MKRNLVSHHRDFRDTPGVYSVSGRRLLPNMNAVEYIRTFYYFVDPARVASVFGPYAFPSKLYGGWGYSPDACLQDHHVAALQAAGIGVALTTTNHFFEESAYRESRALLERFNAPGNSLIITSDDLARRVRRDFPEYKLKASITKGLDTLDKVERALDLYDFVLIPMDKNDDDDFLAAIPQKERVILFANAGCAYTCPARTCYLGNSQGILGRPVTSTCSKATVPRTELGYVAFDVRKLARMGFSYFKLIPPRTLQIQSLLREKGWT